MVELSQPRLSAVDAGKMWKITGVETVLSAQFSRPRKLTKQDKRVPRREARKNHKKPHQIINIEFQQVAGVTVHSNNLRKELHAMSTYGCASAFEASPHPKKCQTHLVFETSQLKYRLLKFSIMEGRITLHATFSQRGVLGFGEHLQPECIVSTVNLCGG